MSGPVSESGPTELVTGVLFLLSVVQVTDMVNPLQPLPPLETSLDPNPGQAVPLSKKKVMNIKGWVCDTINFTQLRKMSKGGSVNQVNDKYCEVRQSNFCTEVQAESNLPPRVTRV